jgi:hypothetical protein
LRDCVTDTSFWLCGSLLAVTTILAAKEGSHASSQALAWFLMASALTVAHGIFFYKPQKIRFDQSGIPYFVRLAKFNGEFLESKDAVEPSSAAKCKARETIKEFLNPDANQHLLIIAGGDDSGKSTLACAIATEFSVWPKHASAPTTRYILMGELYSMVRRERGRYGSSGVVSDTRPISAAAADILLIDEAELTPDHLEALDAEIARNAGVSADPHPVKISDGLKFLLLGKKRLVLVIHSSRVDSWKTWLRNELYTGDDIPTIWINKILDGSSVEPSRTAKILSVTLYAALVVVGMLWLCASCVPSCGVISVGSAG